MSIYQKKEIKNIEVQIRRDLKKKGIKIDDKIVSILVDRHIFHEKINRGTEDLFNILYLDREGFTFSMINRKLFPRNRFSHDRIRNIEKILITIDKNYPNPTDGVEKNKKLINFANRLGLNENDIENNIPIVIWDKIIEAITFCLINNSIYLDNCPGFEDIILIKEEEYEKMDLEAFFFNFFKIYFKDKLKKTDLLTFYKECYGTRLSIFIDLIKSIGLTINSEEEVVLVEDIFHFEI